MNAPRHILPTTVVGSYPQPEWLVDRAMLSKSVPRTRMQGIWRVPEAYLEQAQDDATIVAIRDMERAESILSPMAKFAARATRTGSQPRLRASMRTTMRSSCRVRARPQRCLAWWIKSAGHARLN